jgi:hypothetical protein
MTVAPVAKDVTIVPKNLAITGTQPAQIKKQYRLVDHPRYPQYLKEGDRRDVSSRDTLYRPMG